MTEGRAGLLPIGAFARTVRLSVKALRHYDAEGLLRPAEVDDWTGYRYYALAQVPDAATIALLRSLEVPLPRIRELLAAPDDATRAALVAAARERVAVQVAERQRALVTLDRLAARPRAMRYDVTIAVEAPAVLHAVRGSAASDRLDEGTSEACARYAEVAAAADLRPGPYRGVFPLDLDDPVELHVGLPAERSTVPPGLHRVDLPGGDWASTVHVGPYDELALAYAALLAGVRERGREPSGPAVETYLVDPTTVPDRELVTRLAVALAPGP